MTPPSPNWPFDQPGNQQPRRRSSRRAQNSDCSRSRRFADPIRCRHYALRRQQRFATRMLGPN